MIRDNQWLIAVTLFLFLSACGDDKPADPKPKDMASDTGPDLVTDQSADLPDTTPDQTGDQSKDMPKQDMSADQSNDMKGDMPADMVADMANPMLRDPCTSNEPKTYTVVVPRGETFFFDGDDYLYFWGRGLSCDVTVMSKPAAAQAQIAPNTARLTPDAAGQWVLKRGADTVNLEVKTDYLNSDTFLNYNYSPNVPLLSYGNKLYVTATTSNAIQVFDVTAQGATDAGMIKTGSWPTALATWTRNQPDGDYLLVAQTGRDSLGFVDLDKGELVDAIWVGDEPSVIEVHDGVAYVALRGEDAVVKVDLATRKVIGRVDVGRAPRAMVMDTANKRLYVASSLSMNTHPYGQIPNQPTRAEEQRDIAVIDLQSFQSVGFVPEVGTILRGLMLDAQGDLVVALSHSRNQQSGVEADSRPHAHGLAVVDVDMAKAPKDWAVRQINLDVQRPAASPHTMMASGNQLYVTLSAGRGLLVLDTSNDSIVTRVELDHDPRGLVRVGDTLYTYTWLSNTLSAINTNDWQTQTWTVGVDPTPVDVRKGQITFNDAAFSKNGDFSCNNCHIDGLTDGLVWNILLDGDVNTLSFRNIGGTGPFLWGGFLPTLFDFSREVLRLVGATATGEQMELLTIYMQSVTAPPNPHSWPGGKHSPKGLEGKDVFFGKGDCGSCHIQPLFTDLRQVQGKTMGKSTDTPSLIATYDSGPWGREAQWRTLEDMVAYATQFTKSDLNATELEALTQYVYELPGDALYLNSATPLNGSQHVWTKTSIELVFSAVLSPNQADKFVLESKDDQGNWVAYPGTWETSGRYARFKRQNNEDLPQSTPFRLTVKDGLVGSLGQSLYQSIELNFETGEAPTTDVSGKWEWSFTGQISGAVTIALIQGRGGQVSGTILQAQQGIDFDHVVGYVSGNLLVILPFIAHTSFGDVRVDKIEMMMFDTMLSDGYADTGTGMLVTAFGNLNASATRLALPGQ